VAEIIKSQFFRPFTAEDIKAIIAAAFGSRDGMHSTTLDSWMKQLGLRDGEGDQFGVVGLDFMQTFAVFVGWKYIQDGCPLQRT